MTQEQKDGLIKILQEHLNKVASLPFENYILAESLYTRTMFLYKKYFKASELNSDDLLKVNFKSVNIGTTAKAAWNESHGRLLSFVQSMLDELQLPPGYSTTASAQMAWKARIAYSTTFLIISSFVLWSMNTWAKWEWLTHHNKQAAINLSFEFAILFASALFLTDNKKGRLIEWLGIAASVASMIVSSVA